MSTDDPLATSGTLLQRLKDPSDGEAWRLFAKRYGGAIYDWCLDQGAQNADAEDVTQILLASIRDRLRRFSYERAKGRFRSYLRTMVANACRSAAKTAARRGIGSGDSFVWQQLQKQPDRQVEKIFDPVFDKEILEMASAQVRLEVGAEKWEIFELIAQRRKSGEEVSAQFGKTPESCYMIKLRVQKKLSKAIMDLEGQPGW